MTQVNVQDAKTQLSRLIQAVERGEQIVIARNGKPVAKLVAIEPPESRPVGFVSGVVPEEFFDPLPEEELRRWE